MSANNEVIIRRLTNGLYDIRECQTEDGTVEENTIRVIGTDVDGLQAAVDKANAYLDECDEEGFSVEYGLRILI
jgi:hypothetical protein